jgi:hypothetical protein
MEGKTFKEVVKLTGKSSITIRRLIKKLKLQSDIGKKRLYTNEEIKLITDELSIRPVSQPISFEQPISSIMSKPVSFERKIKKPVSYPLKKPISYPLKKPVSSSKPVSSVTSDTGCELKDELTIKIKYKFKLLESEIDNYLEKYKINLQDFGLVVEEIVKALGPNDEGKDRVIFKDVWSDIHIERTHKELTDKYNSLPTDSEKYYFYSELKIDSEKDYYLSVLNPGFKKANIKVINYK